MPRLAKPAQGKYADFARSVRVLRDTAGMSVQELSDASGVPLSSIYAAESGTRLPSEENFAAMARALGIDAELAAELRLSAHYDALHNEAPDDDSQPFAQQTSEHALSALLRSMHVRAGSPSLRTLAKTTHTSPSVISRFFNGRPPAHRGLLTAILDALDATEYEQEAVTALWRQFRRERISKPSPQTLALLYGTATSCAYPGCTVPLVRWDGEQPTVAVEIVYIEPYSAAMRLEQLDQFDNLILLCPQHHRSRHEANSTDLRAWKAQQAAQSRAAVLLHHRPDDKAPSEPRKTAPDDALPLDYEPFYLAHQEFFHDFTHLHLGSRAAAEEAVHHAFLEILDTWDTLLQQDDLAGMTFAVLQRHIQAVLKREGREPPFIIDGPTTTRLRSGLNLAHIEGGLFAEMTKLPLRQYNVIVLRYLLGYSTRDTARYMGLHPQTVRYHERKGKERLWVRLGLPTAPQAAQKDAPAT
ncbi:helix-turn-helix domain-containing protein [Streptomyces europaeiscabiei]|uniref:helix-turn-helix domain-containing protein n=1 Tax=Streptomyces europaeiscabiei TaxID=146819 RepID=UPI0029A76AC6|nr:helix-turn-helix domain-containing protein [Streptomyces europaeiscabiei]MDX3589097.1 helix-turn-helix domain-containing protein [Streptomyces europaeiscabiei]